MPMIHNAVQIWKSHHVFFRNCFEQGLMTPVHELLHTLGRVRKSKNFPDSKIFTAKTFRIKCVNCDINNIATNARKT